MPGVKFVRVRVAWPAEFRGTGAVNTPSMKNDTVPVGVAAPGATGRTVAVNTTAWPKDADAVDGVIIAVVAAWVTVAPVGWAV